MMQEMHGCCEGDGLSALAFEMELEEDTDCSILSCRSPSPVSGAQAADAFLDSLVQVCYNACERQLREQVEVRRAVGSVEVLQGRVSFEHDRETNPALHGEEREASPRVSGAPKTRHVFGRIHDAVRHMVRLDRVGPQSRSPSASGSDKEDYFLDGVVGEAMRLRLKRKLEQLPAGSHVCKDAVYS
jgi:hypothetical protein